MNWKRKKKEWQTAKDKESSETDNKIGHYSTVLNIRFWCEANNFLRILRLKCLL